MQGSYQSSEIGTARDIVMVFSLLAAMTVAALTAGVNTALLLINNEFHGYVAWHVGSVAVLWIFIRVLTLFDHDEEELLVRPGSKTIGSAIFTAGVTMSAIFLFS